MKKLVCMGILVLMSIFSTVPAYAAANEIQNTGSQSVITPQFTYISFLIPGLSINSSGKASCSGLTSTYNSSHTIKLTIELQKSSASGWGTIKSWSATGLGPYTVDIYKEYYVVRGTYRVCATAKVYNAYGTLLESQSIYSNTVTY